MHNHQTVDSDIDFTEVKARIALHKTVVDDELVRIADGMRSTTKEQFGAMPGEVVDAYLHVLLNGGKRIRGALAIESYRLFGGTDDTLIVQAACALEMLNTYMLVVDDIQDRSELRRGGKTAHIRLKDYHEAQHLKGDALHFGEALAMNSFLIAQHTASSILTQLPTDAATIIKALQTVNQCLVVTAHGQTMDLFVEAAGRASDADVNNILEWKTAYYTFINPLQLGAILARATDAATQAITNYGLAAGVVFQLTDDILGMFGDEATIGKSVLDDIKEGKRTMLITQALKNATTADAYFLESCLANQQLSMHEFTQCQAIIKTSGALAAVQDLAAAKAQVALSALDDIIIPANPAKRFLHDIVLYLLVRTS